MNLFSPAAAVEHKRLGFIQAEGFHEPFLEPRAIAEKQQRIPQSPQQTLKPRSEGRCKSQP